MGDHIAMGRSAGRSSPGLEHPYVDLDSVGLDRNCTGRDQEHLAAGRTRASAEESRRIPGACSGALKTVEEFYSKP
jgi:hypothetical protein